MPTSLVNFVGASVNLKRTGKAFWGHCPFHNEKTRSFKVERRGGKERYHCFGCGAHGDAIDWIRVTRKVGYLEAVRILGEEPATPDPKIIAARKREQERKRRVSFYRDQNPDCVAPDWLLQT